MTSEIALEYIVLRCGDLERSRAFYEALGLPLVGEQHGRGARHYSCSLGSIVIEFYPLAGRPSSGARLGLRIANVAAAVSLVKTLGAEIVRVQIEGPSPSAVIRDPDGHEIALTENAGAIDG